MSEMDRVLDELFASECPHEPGDELPCRECTRDAIAAAEERGRRSEREAAAVTDAGWRAWNECRIREEEAMRVLAKARYWFAARALPAKLIGDALIADIDRALGPDPALAPRDSASQHKDWCALFGNPEAGKSCDCRGAPRDSGKEG